MEATTFTALAERAGRWWTVRVPQIEGLAVQVRSLDQAEMMARKNIAEVLRVPPESIRVEVRTEGQVLPAVTQALQARQGAVRAAEVAARATHAAIEALLADGTTFPEAAIVLGLSPEEIAQFAPGALAAPASQDAGGPAGAPGGPPGSALGGGGSRAAHGRGEAERPVSPSGLPQRTRSSGPMAVHH